MEDVTNMEVIRKFVDANSLMAVLAPPEGEGKNFLAFFFLYVGTFGVGYVLVFAGRRKGFLRGGLRNDAKKMQFRYVLSTTGWYSTLVNKSVRRHAA